MYTYEEFKLAFPSFDRRKKEFGKGLSFAAYDIYKKQEEDKMKSVPATNVPTNSFINGVSYTTVVVDDYCYLATDCCPPKEKKEKENTMTDDYAQRRHLERRIDDVDYKFRNDLRKTFNMDVRFDPKNYKELIEKITKGQFTLDEKITKKIDADDSEYSYWGIMEGIIWTGDVTPDKDGYDAAKKELAKAKQKAIDAAKLLPVADGLKALNDFEAWVPTGKAN